MSRTARAHFFIELTPDRDVDVDVMTKNAIRDRRVFNTVLVLLSAREVRRIGQNAFVRKLPSDLIRLVADMLRITRRDG